MVLASNSGWGQSVKKDRMEREEETIFAMARLYCKGRHGQKGELCKACDELLTYALARLKNCRYKEAKPACAKCMAPCYEPKMRGRIREVMRFSGPRMLYRYPILGFYHLLDGLKKRTS